ncbi:uridine phosphorylase 2 isoform 1-T2 [Glossina fuscipes fuscipes]
MAATKLKNPHLDQMTTDYLYHLNIAIGDTKNSKSLQKQFGDVKFICMGGTGQRMLMLAKYLRDNLQFQDGGNGSGDFINLTESGHRYAVYKIGPVLCCSHGVGISSMSILLHELLKLVKYAKCIDPIFVRVGSSGGIGVNAGTVIITKDAYNGHLRNQYELAILGRTVSRPAKFDETICKEILNCAKKDDNFETIIGNTLSAECFYEGQARLDGASCEYRNEDKLKFLEECRVKDIKNFEMEAVMFSALMHHLDVKAAEVCITFLDRLEGDQIKVTKQQKEEFEKRAFIIVGRYIQYKLKQ